MSPNLPPHLQSLIQEAMDPSELAAFLQELVDDGTLAPEKGFAYPFAQIDLTSQEIRDGSTFTRIITLRVEKRGEDDPSN